MNGKTTAEGTETKAARRSSAGRVIRWFGYAMAVGYALKSIYDYLVISSDATVSVYAFLALIEGGFFVVAGLFIARLGARLAGSSGTKDSPPKD